jgi:hypothetical protein
MDSYHGKYSRRARENGKLYVMIHSWVELKKVRKNELAVDVFIVFRLIVYVALADLLSLNDKIGNSYLFFGFFVFFAARLVSQFVFFLTFFTRLWATRGNCEVNCVHVVFCYWVVIYVAERFLQVFSRMWQMNRRSETGIRVGHSSLFSVATKLFEVFFVVLKSRVLRRFRFSVWLRFWALFFGIPYPLPVCISFNGNTDTKGTVFLKSYVLR